MVAPLSFETLQSNLGVLIRTEGSSKQEGLAKLNARAEGGISPTGLIDIFFEATSIDAALQRTHQAYHYWRDFFHDRDIVPLKNYVSDGIRGIPVETRQIEPHLVQLGAFCGATRPFFNLLNHTPWLKGIFNEYFCPKCTERRDIFESLSQLFGLQKVYKAVLPFRALSVALTTDSGSTLLDLFLIELQAQKVSTQNLHRGLKGFVRIHHDLFETPTCTLGVLELQMQSRRLQLLTAQKVANSEFTLFLQPDNSMQRLRAGLKPGLEVCLKEDFGEMRKKTKVTLGAQIGAADGVRMDRLVHFEVERMQETYEGPLETWIDVPNPGSHVLTIPLNEAILGIKQAINERIKNNTESQFTAAGLPPLEPLRLDYHGRYAIFPRLYPLPAELMPNFTEYWIKQLKELPYTPKPLSFRYVMMRKAIGDTPPEVFYIKSALQIPKDEESLIKIEEELNKATNS